MIRKATKSYASGQKPVTLASTRVTKARAALPTPDEAEQLEFLLHLIADRVRFRILSALAEVDELCVHDLALALDTTDDSISYALRQLRAVRMVQNRREGRLIFYRLATGFPRQLLEHCLVQLVRLSDGSATEADDADSQASCH